MATTSGDDKTLGERLVVFRRPFKDNSFLWWPALLFDSHQQAVSRMGQDATLNSFKSLRLSLQRQFLAEISGKAPPKAIVQLLGGGARKSWYPLDSVDDTHVKRGLEYFSECFGGQSLPDDLSASFAKARDEALELLAEAVPAVKEREEASSSTSNPTAMDVSPPSQAEEQSEKSPAQQKDDDDSVLPAPPDDDETEQHDEPESGLQHHAPPILPNDTFEEAWQKMHAEGWNFVCLHDTQQELYCPPMAYTDAAGNLPSYSPLELIEYMRNEWGWKGEPPSAQQPKAPPPQRRRVSNAGDRTVISSNSTITTVTTPDVRPRLPDPGAPLLSSSDDSSYAGSEKYDRRVLWQRLMKKGWKVVRAWNKLHDWYYLKPGVTRETGVLDENMFLDMDAVAAHCKEQDGYKEADDEDRRLEDLPRRRLNVDEEVRIAKSTTTKRPKAKRKPKRKESPKRKPPRVVTAQKSKPKTSTKKRKKPQKLKTDSKGLPPSEDDIVPILSKIDIHRTKNGGYVVPFLEVDNKKLAFKCGRGLGIFLQLEGIPNNKRLNSTEAKQLERWASFVNVPLAHKDILKWMASNEIPATYRQVRDTSTQVGFEWFLALICRPGCPHDGRKPGEHYFQQDEWETKFRAFVRYAWQLEAQNEEDDGDEGSKGDSSTMSQLPPTLQRKLVRLRLWGATYDTKFPEFRELRDLSTVKLLQAVKPVEFVSVSPTEELSKDKPASETDKDETTDIDNDSVSVVTPPPPKRIRIDSRTWYLGMRPPELSVIWPVLQQIGWKGADATGFTHPNLPNSHFESIHKVRLYMCSQSIPNVYKTKIGLSRELLQLLHWWCVSVNLEWCWDKLKDAKRLSEHKVLDIAYDLGFTTANSMFFRPGADKFDRANREPIPSYNDLLVFLRSTELWNVECEGVPRVGPYDFEHEVVSEEKMVSLLLTAMLVDAKLPIFATPKKILPRRQRKRRQFAESPSSQEDMTKTSDSSSKVAKEATPDDSTVAHGGGKEARVEEFGTSQDSGRNEAVAVDEEVDVTSTENGHAKRLEDSAMEVDEHEELGATAMGELYSTKTNASTKAANKDMLEDVPAAHAEVSPVNEGSSLGAMAVEQEGGASTENNNPVQLEESEMDVDGKDDMGDLEASAVGKLDTTKVKNASSKAANQNKSEDVPMTDAQVSTTSQGISFEETAAEQEGGGSTETLTKELDSGTKLINTVENMKAVELLENEGEPECLDGIQFDPNAAETNPNSNAGFPLLTQTMDDDEEEGAEDVLDDTATDTFDTLDCKETPRRAHFKCPPLSSSRMQPSAPSSPAASVGSLDNTIVQSINDLSDEDVGSSGFLFTQE